MTSPHGSFAHLLNPNYKTDVTRWLAEDCPSFDYGGFVVGETEGEARLLGKSEVGGDGLSLTCYGTEPEHYVSSGDDFLIDCSRAL